MDEIKKGMNDDLIELYLELLEVSKYGTDGDQYCDPTADIAVVRTEIKRWLDAQKLQ